MASLEHLLFKFWLSPVSFVWFWDADQTTSAPFRVRSCRSLNKSHTPSNHQTPPNLLLSHRSLGTFFSVSNKCLLWSLCFGNWTMPKVGFTLLLEATEKSSHLRDVMIRKVYFPFKLIRHRKCVPFVNSLTYSR